MGLKHVNPDGMHRNPVFSQGVLLEGEGRLLVVGGQNGVDAKGEVASGDFGEEKLARPEVLVEIDALALVPERTR